MKLDILTDEELIKLASHQEAFNEIIDKEWRKRFYLSFPYQLVEEDRIYNIILGIFISNEECDKKVYEQLKNKLGEGNNGEKAI